MTVAVEIRTRVKNALVRAPCLEEDDVGHRRSFALG
jgi:hypothetical protein